jgi:hypothetical protein
MDPNHLMPEERRLLELRLASYRRIRQHCTDEGRVGFDLLIEQAEQRLALLADPSRFDAGPGTPESHPPPFGG